MRNKLLSILLISSFVIGSVPPAWAQTTDPILPQETTVTEPLEVPEDPQTAPEVVIPPLPEEQVVTEVLQTQETQLVHELTTVDTADITLYVYTDTETLYGGEISVVPCSPEIDDPETASAFCAMEQSSLATTWSWYGPSAFLNTVEGVGNGSGSDNYWLWFSDGDVGFTSFDDHTLQNGETLVVTIDRMPTRMSVASTSPAVGEATSATVEGFDAFAFAYELLEGAELNGVTAPLTDVDGVTSFTLTGTDPVTVYANKDGYLSSNEVTVTPYEVELPGTSITLEIYTATTTLFSAPLTVLPCAPQDGDAETVNGYCAVEQSDLASTWTWFNFGTPSAFLGTLNGVGNGSGSDNYWTWFSNGDPGFTGLNQHELVEGEKLLIAIDRMPTRLSVATSSPVIGEPTTATVEGFDAFAFAYQALAGASLVGVSTTPTDVSGQTLVTATTTGSFSFYAEKAGYLSSNSVTLTGVATSTDSGSGGPGGDTDPTDTVFDLADAFAFLATGQNGDGSWNSELVTAWAAFALASPGAPSGMKSSLANYFRNEEPNFSSVRDYERHAMALMALNINPYTGGPDDYITPIVESFDGTQIEDDGLVNDDIFALIPLLHVGYDEDDEMIQKITAFIVSEQKSNGSWENSVDVTGAALQALSGVRSLPDVSGALSDGEDFLRSSQKTNGGFGDPFSTSWAIQGIEALGQSAESWDVGENDPLTYLASEQEEDGGLTTNPDDYSTRAWATTYAIPAVKGLTWDDITRDFKKPAGGSTNIDDDNETDTATTTDEVLLPEAEVLVTEQLTSTTSPLIEGQVLGASTGPEEIVEDEASEEADVPDTQPAAIEPTGGWTWFKKLFSSIWSAITGIF